MILQQLLVLLLLFLVVVFVLWVFYSLFATFFRKETTAMYVPSFNRHIRLMKQLTLVSGKSLVDLGCGDGKAMRFFWKTFGVQCDGYEIQDFPYIYGKILNKIFGYPNLKLFKKDFLLADIHSYDYIYVYLLPEQMAHIESWIFKNMKADAIVISNSFQFIEHIPYDTIKNKKGKASIFLYKK